MPDSATTPHNARQNEAHAAVERALAAIVALPAPEARAVGQAVQGHLNELLARFLHPEISFQLEIAHYVATEVDRALADNRRASLTELSQCAIELQEAANMLRQYSPTAFAIFDRAAHRVRGKVGAAAR